MVEVAEIVQWANWQCFCSASQYLINYWQQDSDLLLKWEQQLRTFWPATSTGCWNYPASKLLMCFCATIPVIHLVNYWHKTVTCKWEQQLLTFPPTTSTGCWNYPASQLHGQCFLHSHSSNVVSSTTFAPTKVMLREQITHVCTPHWLYIEGKMVV